MFGLSRRTAIVAVIVAGSAVAVSGAAVQAADDYTRSADGLTAYLGVMPAEIVRGHPPGHPEQAMHGGTPKGSHQYHVVAALFDSASGARISDATVTAQISGLGLAGSKAKLEPMEIAGTISYGGFFNLPGRDLYTVRLTIERPGAARAVELNFKYDHRR